MKAPMGRLGALVVAVLAVARVACEADTPEAKRKKIKMRSSKQLRQLLAEAEVDVPQGTTLEGLREIAYNADVGINGEVPKATPLDDGTEVSAALFKLLDQDADGDLLRGEFETAWSALKRKAAETGVGEVSDTAPADIFGTMDVDGNGRVNQTEAAHVLATMLEVAQAGKGGDKKKGHAKPKRATKDALPENLDADKAKKELQGMAEQLFRLLDTDFDQTLSIDECQMLDELGATSGAGKMPIAGPDLMFKQMDTNKDGMVTREEAADLFKILGDSLGF